MLGQTAVEAVGMATVEPSSERFPGWYRDPMTSTMERFWDGLRWTDRVRVGTDLSADLGPIEPVLADYLAG